jgi:hypothetical protein
MIGSQHHCDYPKRGEPSGQTPEAPAEKVREQDNKEEAKAARNRFK